MLKEFYLRGDLSFIWTFYVFGIEEYKGMMAPLVLGTLGSRLTRISNFRSLTS